MTTDYGIAVSVDSSGAAAGAREYTRSLDSITKAATKFYRENEKVVNSFKELKLHASRSGASIAAEFRKSSQSVTNTTQAMARNATKASRAIADDFRKSAQSLSNNSARMARDVDKVGVAMNRFGAESIRAGQSIKTAYGAMPATVQRATTTIVRQNQMAANSFLGIGRAITQVKVLMAGMLAGFTVRGVVGQIATFEQSIAKIRALMGPDALPAEIAAVTAKARELGATTVFSGRDAAEAMAELVKAGFNAQQAMAAAGAALDLAAADSLDMATAAGIVANILASFAMGADEAGRAADVLAYAANASQTDVRGVGDAMKYAGSVAAALGVPLEDTAAAIGVLSNAGLDASMAGTGLRGILTDLVNPTDQAREAIGRLGLNAAQLSAALREENGLVKVVREFSNASKQMGDDTKYAAEIVTIFGDRAGPAMLNLSRMVDQLEEYTAGAKEANGIAKQMAQTMTDTLMGAWSGFESAAEELNLSLGDSGLTGILRGGVDGMAAFTRGLAGMSEDADKSTKAMQRWNSVGKLLRENVELITDAAVVLATVYVARLIPAMLTKIKTAVAARIEMARYQMTLASMAGVSRTTAIATGVLTTAVKGLRTAMAMLGGPAGVIMLAATAFLVFSNNADKARVSASDLGAEVDQLKQKFMSAGVEQRKLFMMQAIEAQNAAKEEIKAINDRLEAHRKAEEQLKRLRGGPQVTNYGAPGAGVAMSTASISRNLLDAKELQEEKARLEELQAQVVRTNMAMLEMKAMADGTHVSLRAVTATAEEMEETLDTTNTTVEQTAGEFNKLKSALDGLMKDQNALAAAEAKHREELALLQNVLRMSESDLKKLGYTHDQVRLASDNLVAAWETQRKELDPMAVKYKDLVEDMARLRKEFDPLGVAQEGFNKKMARAQELLAMDDEALARVGFTREQLTLYTQLLNRELEASEEAFVKQQLAAEKNARGADPWAKAWESAIERLDGLFVDLWSSAFDGFKGFKDKLVSTFKSMLAELANAATTRAFTGWLSKFLGEPNATVGGSGAINAGVGMVSRGAQLLVSNGRGGTISSAQTGVAMAGGGGMGAGSGSLLAAGFARFAPQIASYGAMATPYVTGAAGLAGGYYGLTNRGQRTGDLGSLAAGASYAAAGYIGASVAMGAITGAAGAAATAGAGAALGGATAGAASAAGAIPVAGWVVAALALIDSVSGGRLFGTRHRPDESMTSLNVGAGGGSATAQLTEVRQRSLFRGRSWRTRDIEAGAEAQDAAKRLYESIKNVMTEAAQSLNTKVPAVIDGAIKTIVDYDGKGRVVGTKYQVRAGGITRDVADAEEGVRWLSAEAIWSVIESVFPKADAIRRKWGPSLEALEQGVESLMGLLSAIRADPAGDARKAFEAEQKSGLELYRRQREEYFKLMASFDGSIESIQRMTEATNSLKNAQFELALAYHQLAEYGKSMFGSTAQNIRESLMTEEELYALRQNQIQTLMYQMREESDPGRLQAMADEINRLTTDAYNMLDEDQRLSMADGFLSFLEEAEALLLQRVGVGLDEIERDSESVTNEAMARLDAYASTMATASSVFADAVDRFVGGIGGGVGTPYSQRYQSELN